MKTEDRITSFLAATIFMIVGYWVAGVWAESMIKLHNQDISYYTLRVVWTILLSFIMIWCSGGATTFILWGIRYPNNNHK